MVVGGMKIGHTLQILFSEMKTLMSCHQQTRPLPLHCHQAECLCWLHENEMYYAWLEKKKHETNLPWQAKRQNAKTWKRGNENRKVSTSSTANFQLPTFSHRNQLLCVCCRCFWTPVRKCHQVFTVCDSQTKCAHFLDVMHDSEQLASYFLWECFIQTKLNVHVCSSQFWNCFWSEFVAKAEAANRRQTGQLASFLLSREQA